MRSALDGEIATALAVLAGAWNVDRIATWAIRDEQAVPLCVRHLWHADIELAVRVWRERGAELRAGRRVRMGGAEFYPLRDGNQELLGFVHAVREPSEAPSPRMDNVAEQVLTRLNAALATLDVADAPVLSREALQSWRAKRAELVSSLDHYDWNFTRLAKAHGVTRQTVRNWTLRFKIRVPEWARGRKPRTT